MLSLFPDLFAFRELAPLLLRLVLGIIFIAHGYPKLFKNPEWGLKTIGIIEFAGGVLLILGFLTQLAGIILAIRVLIDLWKTKIKEGFIGGYEYDVLLLAVAVALIFLGPGPFSIDVRL